MHEGLYEETRQLAPGLAKGGTTGGTKTWTRARTRAHVKVCTRACTRGHEASPKGAEGLKPEFIAGMAQELI